ncbi:MULTISPECIES: hypothetical protein [unclassified Thioalkalivibrio]|uniref:hypothetical protein n=1 Tax=unclassified Thioalkalivibrio TaxID=2621013 RepID=UPI000363F02F|nr:MULTISPECIES: hypothetical protein [unclassified Thioalkalivibrio]
MSRAPHHLLTLLIAAALLVAPIASAGMVHGEPGPGVATQAHCPDQDAGAHSVDPVTQVDASPCELPCAVCGVCGVSALPSSVTMPVTADPSRLVPGAVAIAPDTRSGPDLRPPL